MSAREHPITDEEQVIRDWLAGQLSPSGSPLPPSRRTSQPLPRRQVTAVVATLIEIIDDLRGQPLMVEPNATDRAVETQWRGVVYTEMPDGTHVHRGAWCDVCVVYGMETNR